MVNFKGVSTHASSISRLPHAYLLYFSNQRYVYSVCTMVKMFAMGILTALTETNLYSLVSKKIIPQHNLVDNRPLCLVLVGCCEY